MDKLFGVEFFGDLLKSVNKSFSCFALSKEGEHCVVHHIAQIGIRQISFKAVTGFKLYCSDIFYIQH